MAASNLLHAINYYYSHPVHFVEDFIGVKPELEQAAILNSLVTNNHVAIKSGHGIGKTAVEAWSILWFMTTRPDCKVPCTAPTGHQLEDILWPEVGNWLNKSPVLKSLFVMTKTKLYMAGHEESWFAVPRSCSVPENLQGFHGREILFVVDEASGVPTEIMEVIEGALTNKGAHLLMAGNPTQISGTFFDAFNRDRALYKTFTFNAEKSRLVSPDYCARIATKFGRESDVYRVRVLGEFPRGNPDALIRLEEIEPAIDRKVSGGGVIEIGVDPARYGDDMSVICTRRGLRCLGFDEFSGINTTRLVGEIARKVKELRKEFEFTDMITVKIDDTGVGGGVTDQLETVAGELNVEVIPVNFGSVSDDDDYMNKSADLWGNLKKILPEISIPDDPEMIAQLTSRKYGVHIDGKVKLEKKEDMKKRGLKSPDKADALALAFMPANAGGAAWV